MDKNQDSRNVFFIKMLKLLVWPIIRRIFRIEVNGVENIILQKDQPCLYVANHNSGALIESHSILFIAQQKLGETFAIYGFTHPAIFRVPCFKEYFKLIGGVPATTDMAKTIFQKKHSILIFPGGNKQAFRPVWDYKKNSFRNNHGWAKIAIENKVSVMPITFKGSHFINPIFFSGEWLSKLLVLPWILGIKICPFSLGQLFLSSGIFYVIWHLAGSYWWALLGGYLGFIFLPLIPAFPAKVIITFHPPINTDVLSLKELEDCVDEIMAQLYL